MHFSHGSGHGLDIVLSLASIEVDKKRAQAKFAWAINPPKGGWRRQSLERFRIQQFSLYWFFCALQDKNTVILKKQKSAIFLLFIATK